MKLYYLNATQIKKGAKRRTQFGKRFVGAGVQTDRYLPYHHMSSAVVERWIENEQQKRKWTICLENMSTSRNPLKLLSVLLMQPTHPAATTVLMQQTFPRATNTPSLVRTNLSHCIHLDHDDLPQKRKSGPHVCNGAGTM